MASITTPTVMTSLERYAIQFDTAFSGSIINFRARSTISTTAENCIWSIIDGKGTKNHVMNQKKCKSVCVFVQIYTPFSRFFHIIVVFFTLILLLIGYFCGTKIINP